MCSSNRRCLIRCASRARAHARHSFRCALSLRTRRRSGIHVPGLELATKMILEFCGGEPSEIVVAGKVPDWQREHSVLTRAREEARRHRCAGKTRSSAFWQPRLRGSKASDPLTRRAANLAQRHRRAAPIWSKKSCASTASTRCRPTPMARPHAVAQAVLTPAQRRTRSCAARSLPRLQRNDHLFLHPRAQAKLFGGGDDARQLENPIAADLDALRPSVLPSLLAAASRNPARGVSRQMLFGSRRAIRKRHAGRADKCRRRHSRRRGAAQHGPKSTHARRRVRRQSRHAGSSRNRDGRAR